LFRLTKQDNRVDQALRLFLSHSYEFKSSAEDFTGPDAFTAAPDAIGAVALANRFVMHFAALV
jgi:hypothetical protein